MMLSIRLTYLVAALLPVFANAQMATIEYGEIRELRGITKFYVDTGQDLDLHDIIRTVLEKQLKVTIVDRPEAADHVIVFRWQDGGSNWRGEAFVAKRIAPDRLRVLSNYRAKETELNDLADEYAKWLVKRLKEAS